MTQSAPRQNTAFPSGDRTAHGYLALPASGRGPAVIVIQEWWGLTDHIADVTDRLAAEGFVALAPDLYHGRTTTEPDEAGKLMMTLNMDEAARDMGGAVAFLKGHAAVTSAGRNTMWRPWTMSVVRRLPGRAPSPNFRVKFGKIAVGV